MAAPYSLPESYFYIDKAAAAQYEAQTGDEVVVRQKVNAPAGVVLDAWLQHMWVNGSGAQELQPGEGRGLVNHERFVPPLQAAEQIKSAGLPSDDDASGAVVSILYKVTKAGELPISDHLALVRFIQDVSSQTPVTEIVWTIKVQLKSEGTTVFADPTKLVPFLQQAIAGGLAALAAGFEKA